MPDNLNLNSGFGSGIPPGPSLPNTNPGLGSGLSSGPTIEPGMVMQKGVQARQQAAPDQALGGLDRAFATFFGGANAATSAIQNAGLEQQNTDQTGNLNATRIQGQKDDITLDKKATADAANGLPANPADMAFRSYQSTYAAYKGNNAGVIAAEDFAHNVVQKLGPNDNFDQAVTDYVKGNHFDTGDPFFDAAAAGAFRARAMSMRQTFQGDQVKATVQDGVQALTSTIGNKIVAGTLTNQDIQDGITSYKTLNPMDAANAGPTVIRAVTGAAKTVPQMTSVLSTLESPGSFAPGVSYAQQFPQAYAETNERFARQSADITTLNAAKSFEDIQGRIDTMRETGDMSGLPQLQSDLNAAGNQYGAPAKQHMMERQLIPLLHNSAVQTATFNSLDRGVSDPTNQDPKLFESKGDAYFKARGIDPLNTASSGPAILSGTDAAARAVGAYGTIPSDTKLRMSGALNNGAAPEQQAAAYSFYHQVAATVGEPNVLGMMTSEAQQTYQTVRDMTAGGANVQGVFAGLMANGKRDMKEVPATVIAGVAKQQDAETAITGAVTDAVNNAWNTNGRTILNPITGATAATITPEVTDRIKAQIKSGAFVSQGMGPLDLATLAKQAVEREMPNMQTLPGTDGRPVVSYVPGMPKQVPDPSNGGYMRDVVQAGRAVINPVTKQPEDTTNTSITDLAALSKHMPERFGSSGLSLGSALGSYANNLTKATGVYTVMEGGQAGSPGQPVVLDANAPMKLTLPPTSLDTSNMTPAEAAAAATAPHEITQQLNVTLGNDPTKAAALLEKQWPGNPFVLVKHDTPQGAAYTLGYRFHFTGTLPTAAEREAKFKPDTAGIAAQNYLGLPGVDAVPTSPEAPEVQNPANKAATAAFASQPGPWHDLPFPTMTGAQPAASPASAPPSGPQPTGRTHATRPELDRSTYK